MEKNLQINEDKKKQREPGFRGFTLQLFLLIVFPITLVLLVVVFGSQMLHHEAMRSLVGDRDLKTVRATADSLGHEIAHLESLIQILSFGLDNGTNLNELILSPEEINQNFDGGVALFGTDGKLSQSSDSRFDWQVVRDQNEEYFAAIPNSGKTTLLSSLIHVNDETGSYILLSTLTKNKEILTGAFSPELFIQETIGSLVVSSMQTTFLVISPSNGSNGYDVLFQGGPLNSDESSPSHPGIQEVLDGESGINYFQSDLGEHVVAFSPIPSSNWGLIIEEAWEDIASPYLINTQSAPLVLVPVFLLALLVIWFGASRIVNPLQKLEQQAAKLAAGDFEAIRQPVGGIGDIRNLQTELIEMAESLQSAQQNLHGYIGTITSGIENERLNLSRELHDDTIQALIALNQRIQLVAMNSSMDQKIALEELQNLVQQAMTNLRRMIRGLRPIYLEDLGLITSLEMLVHELQQSSNLTITVDVSGDEFRLDPQKELTVYRMVQESLNNVIQHAEAKQAWVHLVFFEGNVEIQIKDNGKGFALPSSPSEFPKKGHFGLLGLYERADLIKAKLDVVSSPGVGTTISINLPESANPEPKNYF